MIIRQTRGIVLASMLVSSLATIGNAQPVCNALLNFGGGADGSYPQAGLMADGNRLYGAILSDGNYGYGAVFGMDAGGTNFNFLYSFTGLPYWIHGTNTDGAYPLSDLVLSGDSLYGTAWIGGFSDLGTVFKVGTNGLTFTNLFNFSGTNDGAYPYAGMVPAGNTLYGTTSAGGSSDNGAVFAIHTDGTGFTNLYSFSPLDPATQTNTDGAAPRSELVLAGGALYGTTPNGGTSGSGTIFRINLDGTGFTNLYNFTALDPTAQTNLDGARPYAGLVVSGNALYGTTFQGGTGYGTIFRINTDGTGFTNLYTFTPTIGQTYYPSGDGANPYAGLILSGNTLYGTTEFGGDTGFGMVFAINADGTGFANLHSFSSADFGFNVDGAWPLGRLLLIDNTLYGTTSLGGTAGYGTTFSLTLAPTLAITSSGNRVILSWPTWAPHFTLQDIKNLSSGVWNDLPGANIVGANYVFTNIVAGDALFFRLKGQ